jgi:polyhydroxyalkanoate synthase
MQYAYFGFQQLDRFRRLQGRTLDRLGLGPVESAFQVVHEQPGLRLREYGRGVADEAPLLIVPAPIKQPYIWDLAPGTSVVQHALSRRAGVYLVEWTEPSDALSPGLGDYAGAMLADCVDAILERTGADKVILAGHSLGGIFAAIHSAFRHERIGALVLIDSPLHFAAAGRPSREMPAANNGHAAACIPGSMLSAGTARAAPYSFCTSRMLDRVASMRSHEQSLSHWRVERWTLDELPMSRKLFDDLSSLRRDNSFMRGELAIGGAKVGAQQVRAPLFAVYEPEGGFVPASAVLEFCDAASSADKQLAPYHGDVGVALQHIGPLVGASAHRDIWPRIFDWLAPI